MSSEKVESNKAEVRGSNKGNLINKRQNYRLEQNN